MRFSPLVLVALSACVGCSDDDASPPTPPGYLNCDLQELPLSGTASGPVLTEASLECQGDWINVLVTVTDLQGTPDLLGIVQTVGVFRDVDCTAAALEVTDDLAGSGLEESFGVVVEQSAEPALFAAICAASRWPIRVQLADASGDTNRGRVLASVTHAP